MRKIVVLATIAAVAWTAQTGDALAQTPEPTMPTAEATLTTPVQAESPLPQETSTPQETATPVPFPTAATDTLSSDRTLRGTLKQDVGGDGVVSADDAGASTLIELGGDAGGFSLVSALDGSFEFRNLPAGDYVLLIWWSPGFIGVPTSPTNPGLYWAGITVGADGTVRGALPAQILVKPKPEGLVPFPVRTGTENLPVGVVDGGAGTTVTLPSTGSGQDEGVRAAVLKLALLGSVVAAGSFVILRRATRR